MDHKIWQCANCVTHAETGLSVQMREATGKANGREARSEAANIERRGREAAGGGEAKAGKILEVIQRARQEAIKETLSAARARVLLAEMVRISTGEDMPAFTVRTWLEDWKQRKCDVTAPATQARYSASVKAVLAWLGERADKPLEILTVSDVRGFRETLTSEGRTAQTAQHYVRDIGSGLRTAVRKGLLTHNPASGLDLFEFIDSVDRKPFAAAELVKLIAAAPSADWKGMVLLGLCTDLPPGDIAKLKWGDGGLHGRNTLADACQDEEKEWRIQAASQGNREVQPGSHRGVNRLATTGRVLRSHRLVESTSDQTTLSPRKGFRHPSRACSRHRHREQSEIPGNGCQIVDPLLSGPVKRLSLVDLQIGCANRIGKSNALLSL